MKTYQDLLAVGADESDRAGFITQAIAGHKSSAEYKTACDAELYYKHLNPTIMRTQKMIYDLMGRAVPDVYSANNKIPSRYYFYFVTQAVQYLLGNGVTFENPSAKERLGKDFDAKLQRLATYALNGSAGFAFFNVDHIDVFAFTEFVPLYDEENGALGAGIRFWQIDEQKPLRATLYELDGYTEYIKRIGADMEVKAPKRSYKLKIRSNEYTEEIYDGENYPALPVVPLYNVNRQSEIVGGRETLDAYDLMLSQMINNVSDGAIIYWVLKNCNAMDDMDDVKFVERLRTIHVVHADGDEGAEVDPQTVNVPFEASEASLERLRKQLFEDFMALDTSQIAAGNITATQIIASYEPLNSKTDQLEYCVIEFLDRLLQLAGIEDNYSFKRSKIVNQLEETQMVMLAAPYLDRQAVLERLPWLTPEQAGEILRRGDTDELERFGGVTNDDAA